MGRCRNTLLRRTANCRSLAFRYAESGPPIAMRAAFERDEIPGQRLEILHIVISSRAISTDIGGIRAFPEKSCSTNSGMTMIMPMTPLRARVMAGSAAYVRSRWRGDSVIEIETAKKILVGLAASGVLSDDEAGNRFQDFSGTKNRTILDFQRAHRTLGGGIGNSNEAILPARHGHGGAQGTHSQRVGSGPAPGRSRW